MKPHATGQELGPSKVHAADLASNRKTGGSNHLGSSRGFCQCEMKDS
jgi:hypothetical protein